MASGFYLFLVVAVIVTLLLVAGPLWDKKRQLWAELDWRERLMLCLATLAFPCIIWLPVVVLIMASPYLPWLENIVPKSLAPAERLSSDHPSFGRSLNNMAELYRAEGRYTEAELLFKRALALYEKASGPDHPDVSLPLSNIAGLYGDQGRYVEAEALYRRALAIREKAFGPDHPTIGIVLSNLAELYRTQGRYDEAEPLYRRVLAIYEIAFGPNHPNTGDGLNNLALLLRDQGRYAEAEPRLKRSLAIRQGSLGADHPDVGIGLNNLAELYLAQGRYAEAVPVYKRSLVILETVLDGRSSRESDRNTSSAREMFQIAQLASDAAASLAQMAARGVKDDLRLASSGICRTSSLNGKSGMAHALLPYRKHRTRGIEPPKRSTKLDFTRLTGAVPKSTSARSWRSPSMQHSGILNPSMRDKFKPISAPMRRSSFTSTFPGRRVRPRRRLRG